MTHQNAFVSSGLGLTGTTGAMAAWLLQSSSDDGTPIIVIVGVVLVAALFGMVSSLSRLTDRETPKGLRKLVMNAGAVWIMALGIVLQINASLPLCALLGLGIGLAGSAALEIVERGTLALATKIFDTAGLATKEELDEKLGDVRQKTQIAVAETQLQIRKIDLDPEAPKNLGDPEV